MTRYSRIGLLAAALAPACDLGPEYCEGDWATVPPDPMASTPQSRLVAQVLPVESTAVDMLFVIDDSLSMTDEQEQLAIWSSELFDVLSASGELPDLHIAVTSSSVAIPDLPRCETGGTLHVGGAVLQDGRFIRDVAGPSGRERNYSGTLTDTFAKMAPFKRSPVRSWSAPAPKSPLFARTDKYLYTDVSLFRSRLRVRHAAQLLLIGILL